MQFIEKNSFNARTVVYSLKKDTTALEFVVFPMIHVGSREFYQEISRRLSTCDLILFEGVKSKKATILTLSYRFIKKIRRMNLISKGLHLMSAGPRCRSTLRAQLFIIVPIFVLYLFLFGTRETLAEHLALEDLPTSEEILLEDESFSRLDSCGR